MRASRPASGARVETAEEPGGGWLDATVYSRLAEFLMCAGKGKFVVIVHVVYGMGN